MPLYTISITLFLILLIALCLYYILYLWHIVFTTIKGNIFYYPTHIQDIELEFRTLIDELDIDVSSVSFYDIGSGLGSMIEYVYDNYPFKEHIGIEIDPVMFVYSKIHTFITRRKIRVLLNSSEKVNYGSNNLIYAYLNPKLINQLYQSGALKGNIFVSLTFALDDIEPNKIFIIPKFQKKLSVYDFR